MINYKVEETSVLMAEPSSRLEIKVINANPNNLQEKIDEFIAFKPMDIIECLQSESQGDDGLGITFTIFYYSKKRAHFLEKRPIVGYIRDEVLESIIREYQISFEEILELIWDKVNKK